MANFWTGAAENQIPDELPDPRGMFQTTSTHRLVAEAVSRYEQACLHTYYDFGLLNWRYARPFTRWRCRMYDDLSRALNQVTHTRHRRRAVRTVSSRHQGS